MATPPSAGGSTPPPPRKTKGTTTTSGGAAAAAKASKPKKRRFGRLRRLFASTGALPRERPTKSEATVEERRSVSLPALDAASSDPSSDHPDRLVPRTATPSAPQKRPVSSGVASPKGRRPTTEAAAAAPALLVRRQGSSSAAASSPASSASSRSTFTPPEPRRSESVSRLSLVAQASLYQTFYEFETTTAKKNAPTPRAKRISLGADATATAGPTSPDEGDDASLDDGSEGGAAAAPEPSVASTGPDDDDDDGDDDDFVALPPPKLWSKKSSSVSETRVPDVRDLIESAVTPVILHVYEVGHRKAVQRLNAVTRDLLGKGGAFHTAVELYGTEWSFGYCADPDRCGIFSCAPRRCPLHTFRESVFLGDCALSHADVRHVLDVMRPDWPGAGYDLLTRNCNDFAAALVLKLGLASGIPAWCNRFAKIGAKAVRRGDDLNKPAANALHDIASLPRERVKRAMRRLRMLVRWQKQPQKPQAQSEEAGPPASATRPPPAATRSSSSTEEEAASGKRQEDVQPPSRPRLVRKEFKAVVTDLLRDDCEEEEPVGNTCDEATTTPQASS